MSLDVFNVQQPNRGIGATTDNLIVEEFTGLVKGTIERKSVISDFFPLHKLSGTDTMTSNAIGESTVGVLVPGVTPNGTTNQFSKTKLTVDTVLFSRATFTLIDVWRTSFDARRKVAEEQGKKLAKILDQTIFTMATKAGLATTSAYAVGGVAPTGHFGGTQVTLAAAADRDDPAALIAGLLKLFAAMELKDVQPSEDGVMLAVAPREYYTLLQAEQLINSNYITSSGVRMEGVYQLKGYGVPIIRSNNYVGGKVVTSLLSNAANGNAYNGDFTKVIATAFSPEAVMAAELSGLQSDVFFDKVSKHWYVDSWQSYGATSDRNEYAGVLLIP